MISNGISAPSTAFVASACGRSGTGIVTGVAPIASVASVTGVASLTRVACVRTAVRAALTRVVAGVVAVALAGVALW